MQKIYFDNRSQRLYESSLVQHWYRSKGMYFHEMNINIVENSGLLKGRHLSRYYNDPNHVWNSLSIDKMESLFLFVVYDLSMCFVVLLIELIYNFSLKYSAQ